MEQAYEVNGHSPITFNERIAILFYLLEKETDCIFNIANQTNNIALKEKIKNIKRYSNKIADSIGVLLKLGLKSD